MSVKIKIRQYVIDSLDREIELVSDLEQVKEVSVSGSGFYRVTTIEYLYEGEEG